MHTKPLMIALAALLISPMAATAQTPEFMAAWDADSDGTLTLEEAKMKRADIFVMFDADSNGLLAGDEWVGVQEFMVAQAEAKGKGQGAGQGNGNGNGHGGNGPGAAIHAAMAVEYNDADGDGSVTPEEFDAASDVMFVALDRNSDGIVNSADFGR